MNVGNADEATQEKRASIIEAAQPSDETTLEQRLTEMWEQTLKSMPQRARNLLPLSAAEQFIQDQYYTGLEDVVKERIKRAAEDGSEQEIKSNGQMAAPPPFRALYDVGIGGADTDTKARRRELIETAIPNDGDETAADLDEAWKNLVNQMPQSVRATMSKDAAAKYREECYFDALEQVIKRRKTKAADAENEATFTPEYPVEVNSDDVRTHMYRASLLSEALPKHAKAINALLSKNWQEHIGTLAPFERATLSPHAEKRFAHINTTRCLKM